MAEINANLPPVEVRRQILIARRDELQRQGFAFDMEIELLKVQDMSREADKTAAAEQIANLTVQSANAFAAARRVTELLEALPTPPAKPALAK